MVDHWLKASSSVAAVELEGGLILTFLAVAWAMQRVLCRNVVRTPWYWHGNVRSGMSDMRCHCAHRSQRSDRHSSAAILIVQLIVEQKSQD